MNQGKSYVWKTWLNYFQEHNNRRLDELCRRPQSSLIFFILFNTGSSLPTKTWTRSLHQLTLRSKTSIHRGGSTPTSLGRLWRPASKSGMPWEVRALKTSSLTFLFTRYLLGGSRVGLLRIISSVMNVLCFQSRPFLTLVPLGSIKKLIALTD